MNLGTTAFYFKSGVGKRGAVVLHVISLLDVLGLPEVTSDSNCPSTFSLQVQLEVAPSRNGYRTKQASAVEQTIAQKQLSAYEKVPRFVV